MDDAAAQALAEGYVAFLESGDRSVFEMFSPDFHDHVSHQSGLGVFDTVLAWFDETMAERNAELHLVTHTHDTVMFWCTVRGRHVGNGFPRLKGLPVRGRLIEWPQVHVYRFADGLVTEHWAVRDDAAVLDVLDAD